MESFTRILSVLMTLHRANPNPKAINKRNNKLCLKWIFLIFIWPKGPANDPMLDPTTQVLIQRPNVWPKASPNVSPNHPTLHLTLHPTTQRFTHKNNCPGTNYCLAYPRAKNNGRDRSACWIGDLVACSLRVRAGFYWIRVNKCLNTIKKSCDQRIVWREPLTKSVAD